MVLDTDWLNGKISHYSTGQEFSRHLYFWISITMFSTLVFKKKESTVTERKFKSPPPLNMGKNTDEQGKRGCQCSRKHWWYPKRQSPQQMWTFSNWEPALQMMKSYLVFEQEADIAAAVGSNSISMRGNISTGHIAEAPACFRCTVMYGNAVRTFVCGHITINGQSLHRATSAVKWGNVPPVTTKAAF